MGRVNPTEYATLRPVSHLVNSFVPPAPSARIWAYPDFVDA